MHPIAGDDARSTPGAIGRLPRGVRHYPEPVDNGAGPDVRRVGTSATRAPQAPSAKAVVKPRSSGTSVPASVFAEMIAAAAWAPKAPPTVRMMVFMPLATPVSSGRELATTSAP